MKTSDFKKIQKDFGFTNQEMANALKTSRRNIDNWRSGRIRVPGPVVVALYFLIERKQGKVK